NFYCALYMGSGIHVF
nr:immunoglobulin light chain junction region [Macaca mulatta]MOW61269.1 immunoglobulin light chain junction region [Macaca mulatta]